MDLSYSLLLVRLKLMRCWPTTSTPLSPWAPKSLCQVSLSNRIQTARPPLVPSKGSDREHDDPSSFFTHRSLHATQPYYSILVSRRTLYNKRQARLAHPSTHVHLSIRLLYTPIPHPSSRHLLTSPQRHGQATRGAASCASPARTPSHCRGRRTRQGPQRQC